MVGMLVGERAGELGEYDDLIRKQVLAGQEPGLAELTAAIEAGKPGRIQILLIHGAGRDPSVLAAAIKMAADRPYHPQLLAAFNRPDAQSVSAAAVSPLQEGVGEERNRT